MPWEKAKFEALDRKGEGMAPALWLAQRDPSAKGCLHTSQIVNCGDFLEKDDSEEVPISLRLRVVKNPGRDQGTQRD